MKKLKVLKGLIVILMAILCLSTIASSVYGAYDWAGKITAVDGLSSDANLDKSANTIIGAIIGVMRIVATGVAFIMIIAVAVKYMSAAPGDRADIKKHAVPFVIGAVVLFASSGILSIIQKFATNIKA